MIRPLKTLAVLLSAALMASALPPEALLHAANVARVRAGALGRPVEASKAGAPLPTGHIKTGPASVKIPDWKVPAFPSINPTASATPGSVEPGPPLGPQSAQDHDPLSPTPSLIPDGEGRKPAQKPSPSFPGAPGNQVETALETAQALAEFEKPDLAPGSDEETTAEAGLFDGAGAPRPAAVTQPAAASADEAPGRLGRFFNRLAYSAGRKAGRLLPRKLVKILTAPSGRYDSDSYGGPEHKKLSFLGRIAYGLKWGINLLGIGTILEFGIKPLLSRYPWQLHAPPDVLDMTGRVELLTRMGPKEIAHALGSEPVKFLFLQVPLSALWEELCFRVLGFGLSFLILAAMRPAAAGISKFLEKIPNLFNLRKTIQSFLALVGGISNHAFALAAWLSAVVFTVDHFAAWGINPFVIAVHMTLGLGLAYVAYRTRSLVAPFVAHLTYLLLSLGGSLLAISFLMPVAGQIYGMLLGVGSLAFLYFSYRSYHKEKTDWLVRGGFGALKARMVGILGPIVMALALVGVVWNGHSPDFNSRPVQAPKSAVPMQQVLDQGETKKAAAQKVPRAAGHAQESWADVIERSEASVVTVILPQSLGSGFIVSKEGLLVTNAHVAGPAGRGGIVIIQFSNGHRVEARVLDFNHDPDLALIQLPKNPKGWPALPIGDSSKLRKGEEVVAMGSPRGLSDTVTRGIISNTARGSHYVRYLQTDTPINPGNSGGPLLNRRGEVIGVNTSIATTDGGSQGLGFAISSADVQRALDRFAAAGNIDSSWLGVIVDKTDPLAPDHGVLIEQVRPGSPAAQAGLKPGDVILSVDDEEFPKDSDDALEALAQALASKNPGEKISLRVARQDQVLPLEITLGNKK